MCFLNQNMTFELLLRYILNYLCNGELSYPNDRVFQEDLLSEAKFLLDLE